MSTDCSVANTLYLWKVVFMPVYFFLPLYCKGVFLAFSLSFLMYGTGISKREGTPQGVADTLLHAFIVCRLTSFILTPEIFRLHCVYGGFPWFASLIYFLWKGFVWSVVKTTHSQQSTLYTRPCPLPDHQFGQYTCWHFTQNFSHSSNTDLSHTYLYDSRQHLNHWYLLQRSVLLPFSLSFHKLLKTWPNQTKLITPG